MHAAGWPCPDRPATPYGPWSLVPKVRNSERPEIHRLFGDLTRTNDFILYVGLARALDVERAFHPCDISTKETNDRGDNSHEGNRGNGSGCGNGRDEAGRAARAAGSDKRRHRSDSCVGIRPD